MPHLIKGMVPPRGFRFNQGDVLLESYSEEELVNVVTNYRAENNLPVGDVQGDIERQICGQYPHSCHDVDHLEINIVSNTRPTPQGELLQDITAWASNLLRSTEAISLVDDETAEGRSKICRACPNNANWRGKCAPCVTSAERICASVRQGRDTFSSKVLGGCHALRHDNRTAIFIEKEHLSTCADLPKECWILS